MLKKIFFLGGGGAGGMPLALQQLKFAGWILKQQLNPCLLVKLDDFISQTVNPKKYSATCRDFAKIFE